MMKQISKFLGVSILELYECADENIKDAFDDYEFNKLLRFKKENFISYTFYLLV